LGLPDEIFYFVAHILTGRKIPVKNSICERVLPLIDEKGSAYKNSRSDKEDKYKSKLEINAREKSYPTPCFLHKKPLFWRACKDLYFYFHVIAILTHRSSSKTPIETQYTPDRSALVIGHFLW